MKSRPERGQSRNFDGFLSGDEVFPQGHGGSFLSGRRAGKIEVIGIGVSTGGPNALQKIVPLLEERLAVPILAVQHMPPKFTAALAERLDRESKISIEEAREGVSPEPGKMYVAPGGHHLTVQGSGMQNVLRIIDLPPVNNCRPSIDVLFQSMAAVYGGNILAIILTGMGRDGAAGVAAIRKKGGYCIVQDEATSAVWGIPQAVVEAREADEILPVNKIAQRIMEIAGGNRGR